MLQLTSEQLEQYTELLEEADKAFTGKIQRDAVAQAQADIFFQLGMRDKSLMQWGLNSIATAKGAYSTAMMDIVSKFEAGTYDSTKAFSRWRNATKRAMEMTYRGGAASVGNPFYKDLKIPMRDQRLMARYLNKEGKFFKGLLSDIKNPKFLPANQIPRDAKGNMLPGYKMQHFSFQQRAGMYPESMKAMRYNGALMGAGSNVEIHWVLGAPMTKHCPDCPQLAARVWTPETLPTVPGAGDTQCIYRCYCSLEIRQKARGREFDLAGRATEGAIRAAGKNARVYDARGNEVGGVLQADIEAWTAEMNRARQMVSITTGDVRMDWIMRRKQLNRLMIDRAKVGGYRVVPTTSVRALVDTVKTVAAKGGSLVDDFMALRTGQEVWLVRGDYSSFGVMGMRNGRLVFKSPTGIVLEPIARTDIIFSTAPGYPAGYKGYNDATIVSMVNIKDLPDSPRGIRETYKAKLSNGEYCLFKTKSSAPKCEYEVMSYEVARALGYGDLVPMTVMKTTRYTGITGSAQKWVKGDVYNMSTRERAYAAIAADGERMAILDIVLAQSDRHGNNYMITKVKGKWRMKAIDNEFSFSAAPGQQVSGFHTSDRIGDLRGQTISASAKSALRKLVANKTIDRNLSLLDDEARQMFWFRVETLLEMETYDAVRFSDIMRQKVINSGGVW